MKLGNLPSFFDKINMKNIDKALVSFGKGMDAFSKIIDEFGKSMDSMTKELSADIKESDERQITTAKKNQDNIKKLFGNSKIKIWSD